MLTTLNWKKWCDKNIVYILNRIRSCIETKDEIGFHNQVFHKPVPWDPTFPYKDVEQDNKKILLAIETDTYTLIASDKIIDSIEKMTFEQKICICFP